MGGTGGIGTGHGSGSVQDVESFITKNLMMKNFLPNGGRGSYFSHWSGWATQRCS